MYDNKIVAPAESDSVYMQFTCYGLVPVTLAVVLVLIRCLHLDVKCINRQMDYRIQTVTECGTRSW